MEITFCCDPAWSFPVPLGARGRLVLKLWRWERGIEFLFNFNFWKECAKENQHKRLAKERKRTTRHNSEVSIGAVSTWRTICTYPRAVWKVSQKTSHTVQEPVLRCSFLTFVYFHKVKFWSMGLKVFGSTRGLLQLEIEFSLEREASCVLRTKFLSVSLVAHRTRIVSQSRCCFASLCVTRHKNRCDDQNWSQPPCGRHAHLVRT